ncbi:MAG: hypothetical protein MI749_09085, partial [Desulfovibrionales bacterium]|nr:hypothetical protein [Desulfovibrionales bacterium]
IDLELAKLVEAKFKSRKELSSDKWKTLCHRCREAKERILEHGERSVRITIKGEGRALIAGTLSAELTRGEVESILRGQFFGDVTTQALSDSTSGKQIADFGLPFESEASVTKHIILFLEKHRENIKAALGKEEPMPDFILFNGGTLKPSLVQSRIKESIRRWFKTCDGQHPVVLENDHPELAVGVGASYYGLVKQGIGVRVGSGSPRSYYLGVSSSEGPLAVCLVERGLDEGSVIDLPQTAYQVRANEPVAFDVYSSSFRSGDHSGDLITIDDSLSVLPPVKTIIKFGKKGDKKQIPVNIGAEYTEMGTLSMYCQSSVSDHKWKLQFQLRSAQDTGIQAMEGEVYEDQAIETACRSLRLAFEDTSTDLLKRVVKQIEGAVEQSKGNWPLSFFQRRPKLHDP